MSNQGEILRPSIVEFTNEMATIDHEFIQQENGRPPPGVEHVAISLVLRNFATFGKYVDCRQAFQALAHRQGTHGMPYKLLIAEELRDTLAESLPGAVLDDLSDALNEFAESPTRWSKLAEIPFLQYHQQFDHEVIHENRRYLFRVYFKYGQDEQTLHIGDIRWV